MTVEKLREWLLESVSQWMGTIEGEWGIDLTYERVELEGVVDSLIATVREEKHKEPDAAGPRPMSVRELLNNYAGWYATDVGDRMEKLAAYESAICEAVIHEASARGEKHTHRPGLGFECCGCPPSR